MTCIVAIRTDTGQVIVGADRQGTAGWTAHQSAHPKIREHAGIITGVAGSIRLAQVIQHELDWDDLAMRLRGADDPYTWAITKVIPTIRSNLGEHAALTVKDNVATTHETAVIIAIPGHVYVIDSDLQVYENAEPYAAIGSGDQIALGSLWSTSAMHSAGRVMAALEAAARWNIGVGGPFDMIHTANPETPA